MGIKLFRNCSKNNRYCLKMRCSKLVVSIIPTIAEIRPFIQAAVQESLSITRPQSSYNPSVNFLLADNQMQLLKLELPNFDGSILK